MQHSGWISFSPVSPSVTFHISEGHLTKPVHKLPVGLSDAISMKPGVFRHIVLHVHLMDLLVKPVNLLHLVLVVVRWRAIVVVPSQPAVGGT